MDATSSATSESVSITASTLSYSTPNFDWGSKGWNLFLIISNYGPWIYGFSLGWYVRKSSWELFPMCFNSLVHIVLILCCSGVFLVRLLSGTLAILLEDDLVSLLRFTLFFNTHVRVLTIYVFSAWYWTYQKLLIVSWSVTLKYWSGWFDDGLSSFRWRSYGLIVDNVSLLVKLYCILF